jgi:GxxExxY protein
MTDARPRIGRFARSSSPVRTAAVTNVRPTPAGLLDRFRRSHCATDRIAHGRWRVGHAAQEIPRGGAEDTTRRHGERQRLIGFSFDDVDIEDAFRADLLVEGRVIGEVKSLERLTALHKMQLLTYLRLTELRVGLLLNFGAETMGDGVKRVVNNYTASGPSLLRINQVRGR